jgi:hypothetical protein
MKPAIVKSQTVLKNIVIAFEKVKYAEHNVTVLIVIIKS